MPLYRKKQLQEFIPWTTGMSMDLVSISEADKENGCPKEGDMIALNPKDNKDRWLVAKEFFEENYELVSVSGM